MPRKSKKKPGYECNPEVLLQELQEMIQHPRFCRYKLGIRQRGRRFIVFEAAQHNVKATFLLPGETPGQLYVNDSIVHTMVRVAGGEEVQAFNRTYGPGKRSPHES